MLRGGLSIVTAFYRRIFMKKKLLKHNIIGIGCVFVGVLLVGSANIMFPMKKNSTDATVFTISFTN